MADIELPTPEDVEEKSKDRFSKTAAMTVAVYAVVLAIAALGGNNAAKDAMRSHLDWANQWSHYQARVIREHEYRTNKMRLELDMAGWSGEQRQKGEKLLKEFADKEQEYKKDKQENMDEAKKFGEVRDRAIRQDPYFDYAEVFLQIAIVVASVSMLASSRSMYGASLVLAAAGAFLTVNGYTLWVAVPYLE